MKAEKSVIGFPSLVLSWESGRLAANGLGRPEGRLQRMGRPERGRRGIDEKERGQRVKEGDGKNRAENERFEDTPG